MRNLNILQAANINRSLLLERISDKSGKISGFEKAHDIMCCVFGLFGLSMNGGVLVDLLAEFSEDGLALGDILEEGRLDMVHQSSIE